MIHFSEHPFQVMDICNQACDNHAANNELCAKNIKVDQVSVEMMKMLFSRKFLTRSLGLAGTSLLVRASASRSVTRPKRCSTCSLPVVLQFVSGNAPDPCEL